MNILENFNDLRHDDNLLDNFFKDKWNFNQFFLVCDDFHWNINYPVDNLKDLFDMIDISHSFFEFFKHNCLFNNLLNFLHTFIFVAEFNNLFSLLNNFLDSFHYDWDLDNLLDNVLNVSVDVDQLRNDLLDFNDAWNFYQLFLEPLDLVDLGNND
jgi:hypothetical protein